MELYWIVKKKIFFDFRLIFSYTQGYSEYYMQKILYTLLKIKVLHDAVELPFCLNGFITNL